MRGNDLSSILRQTQRRTVQNTVEANGNFRGEQVRLVDQKNSPVQQHGKRQWTVFIDHAPFLQGNMAAQIGKLQSSMPGDFKCGIVQPCGKLLDERRLPASSGAVQIQRIKVMHEPDDHIPCRFMKNVPWINGRGVRTRFLVAFEAFPVGVPVKTCPASSCAGTREANSLNRF